MKEVTEILRLLVKAIERSTVNTMVEQGFENARQVIDLLIEAERKIDALAQKVEE